MAAMIVLFSILCTGCYRDHLYVQMEKIDREFLASSHVDTPDPKQLHPPEGKRLLIAWRFPYTFLDQGLFLRITTRFWDQTEEVIVRQVETGHGYTALNFFDKRLITYKIDVVEGQGEVIETWEHQLWTKLIDVSNRSVFSQPIQPSVTETP